MTQPTEVSGTAMPGPGVGPLGLAIIPAVLVAPENGFRGLARDPQWIGPFVVVALLVAIGARLALPATLEFSAQTAEATMARMGLSEEQRAEAVTRIPSPDDRSPKVLLQNVGLAPVLSVLFGVVGALILHLIAKIAGRSPTFRSSLALFGAASVVSGIGALVKSGLIAASGTVEVTLGPGAALPDFPLHSVPAILLDLLDVFSCGTSPC
jgi:hypothetical protein